MLYPENNFTVFVYLHLTQNARFYFLFLTIPFFFVSSLDFAAISTFFTPFFQVAELSNFTWFQLILAGILLPIILYPY